MQFLLMMMCSPSNNHNDLLDILLPDSPVKDNATPNESDPDQGFQLAH